MPERINKLQPNRLLHLRGFDSLGAAAALHSATADSFEVSGVFRDAADFAVLILHDKDNFYEHPRLKHLPDSDFDGLTLTFDVRYEGLMSLDSPKFATISWPVLSVIRDDAASTPAEIRLSEHATQVGGTQTAASGSFTIVNNSLRKFDRLVLWYLNYNFDYLVDQDVDCVYAFIGGGVGTVHRITVDGVDYTHTETVSDTNTSIALAMVAALAPATKVSAIQDPDAANQVIVRAALDDNAPVPVTSSAGSSYTLYCIGAGTVASALAAQINALDWTGLSVLMPLTAVASGATLTITSQNSGVDGNMITLYAVAKNSRLTTDVDHLALTGGVSDAVWRVTLDFAALSIPHIRQMWFTYAPALANGERLESTEWRAIYTNWTLSGPDAKQRLVVAGPDSVRVEHNDAWCTYTGTWVDELGFYSNGYARRANTVGQTVTVRYACATTHDLYLGTSLYSDRGKVNVSLDGGAPTELDCYLSNLTAVNTRRRVRTAVPAGEVDPNRWTR